MQERDLDEWNKCRLHIEMSSAFAGKQERCLAVKSRQILRLVKQVWLCDRRRIINTVLTLPFDSLLIMRLVSIIGSYQASVLFSFHSTFSAWSIYFHHQNGLTALCKSSRSTPRISNHLNDTHKRLVVNKNQQIATQQTSPCESRTANQFRMTEPIQANIIKYNQKSSRH